MSSKTRHITPVSRKAATGGIAAVYDQTAKELGATAFEMLSPAPDVMVATWSLARESLVAGQVPRINKEIVATAVSVANDCPFCVDAHAIFMHAAGEHGLAEALRNGETLDDPEHAALAAWATATRSSDAPELASPPYRRDEAAEYIGTALAFHFINRMMSVLQRPSALPGNLQRSKTVRRLGGIVFARAVNGRHATGTSLSLLGDLPSAAPPDWAGDKPMGAAYAALLAAATAGPDKLSDAARTAVVESVTRWDGQHPPVVGGWWEEPMADLQPGDRPAAKLALLAAMAPYRVADADIAAWRRIDPEDSSLVRLLAFGAMTAVQRAEAAIVAASMARHEREGERVDTARMG